MELALREAEKAYNEGEIPVGAVIVEDGKVLSFAHNIKNKSNSVIDHAEIIAITEASKIKHNWRLDECDIYITVEPCPMCASAIHQSRIKNIYYGCSSGRENNTKIVKEILKQDEINRKTIMTGGLLGKECMTLINNFFNNKRKK